MLPRVLPDVREARGVIGPLKLVCRAYLSRLLVFTTQGGFQRQQYSVLI